MLFDDEGDAGLCNDSGASVDLFCEANPLRDDGNEDEDDREDEDHGAVRGILACDTSGPVGDVGEKSRNDWRLEGR